MERLSKTQVDKIGERLRSGELDEGCLTDLARYQAEFDEAYAYVERILTSKLYLSITGRPAKSTLSIIEKLRRIKSRLSQIQDISGCRAIVHTIDEQDEVVRRAREWFPLVQVDDKRDLALHGYRAVHLIVGHQGKWVEIQVRTRIQHFWATISEKLSDTFGQEIKYGSGNEVVLKHLLQLSDVCLRFDAVSNKIQRRSRHLESSRRMSPDAFRLLKKEHKADEARMREIMYAARSVLIEFDKLEAAHVLSH